MVYRIKNKFESSSLASAFSFFHEVHAARTCPGAPVEQLRWLIVEK